MSTQNAALLFTLLSAVVALFQLALALGAPWGEFTLGGKWRGSLPRKIRVVPLTSLLLLAGFSAVILARSGLAFADFQEQSRSLVWIVVGYCALGSIANAVTPSRRERNLWLPVVLIMLITSLMVASS